jgi:signal transduction histidine kinase
MITTQAQLPSNWLQKIDFNNLIKHSVEELSNSIAKDEMDIQVDVNGKYAFWGNEKLLQIVFNNLISNGIKYRKICDDHSTVKLSVFTHETKAIIHVEDNGKGIAPNEIDKIFNLFHRSAPAEIGSGMGLYMAKEIIEKLGGKITVESALNVGTAFTFELPNQVFMQNQSAAENNTSNHFN